jgi:hypothetical protein
MGQQLGELFKTDWSEFISRRFDVMTAELSSIGIEFCRSRFVLDATGILHSLERFTPNEFSELMGVAEAADVQIVNLVLALGYTDIFDLCAGPETSSCSSELWLRDSTHECTSFIIRDRHGRFRAGQTWDMPIETSDFATLVLKQPTGNEPYYSYSLLGCLSYIGLNSTGLCIGTTKVTSKDIGLGVFFPALVQAALSHSTPDDAVAVLSALPKVAGHYFYVVSPTRALACEVSANKCTSWPIETDNYVHTNHYDDTAFLHDELEYSSTSITRRATMTECILSSGETLTLDHYRRSLSDHGTGLCRHGDDGEKLVTVTGTSVYLEPERRALSYSDGPPCGDRWFEVVL